jgi:hypothetical protein
MGLDKINAVPFPIPAVKFSQDVVGFKSSRRETDPSPINSEETEGRIKSSQSEFVELQKINDSVNELAKIRKGFETRFEKVDSYLEQMKEQLERIIKQFPPFPPGSEDRVKALRAFTFFRKMIDQLTLPPRDEVLMESSKQPPLTLDQNVLEKAIPVRFVNPQTSSPI